MTALRHDIPASILAMATLKIFPDLARWDALRATSEMHTCPANTSEWPLALAAHADRLPDSLGSDLCELLPQLTGTWLMSASPAS